MEERVKGEEGGEAAALQAFVHFSALCTRRKVGGTDRFKLRRVPESDAALTLTRLYRVCAKVLRAERILRGKSGPSDATPPSSRRPRRRRRRLFLLCVKTAGVLARIRVKSGVEGSAAERMERSCYFGKLSGRHERIGGGGEGRGRQTHVGACHDPLHQSTVRRFPAISPMAPQEIHQGRCTDLFSSSPPLPQGIFFGGCVSESGCQVYPPRFFRVVGWTRWDTERKE